MQKKNTIRPRKRFSQNFLRDKNIINKIVDAIEPLKDDHVIEIGPGNGALTFALLEKINQIEVIEIDRDLVSRLRESDESKKIDIHQTDALKFNFASSYSGKKIRIVGNLPYHISTPLIFHLIKFNEYFDDLHLMVQKEVADRIVSKPNSRIFGRLSVSIQARCNAEKVFDVKPNAFYPKPKVMSSVVKISPKPQLDMATDEKLNQLLLLAFNQRRKKISNSLKSAFTIDEIKELGIDPESRPENLTVDEFLLLSKRGISK
tara:strand:+ start:141 stop:923 length:783 start_codon:yes stop_codon:yes gene_type:complete